MASASAGSWASNKYPRCRPSAACGSGRAPVESCPNGRHGWVALVQVIQRRASGVLGEPVKIRVSAGLRQNGGIAFGHSAPSLPVDCSGYDTRPTAGLTGVDKLIDELDDVVRQSDGNLRRHTRMVLIWDAIRNRNLQSSAGRRVAAVRRVLVCASIRRIIEPGRG